MGKALIKQAGSGGTKIKFKNYGGPTLEKREVEGLSKARYEFAATSVGDYALFGGGYYSEESDLLPAIIIITQMLMHTTRI